MVKIQFLKLKIFLQWIAVGEEIMFWGVPLMDNSMSVDIFPAEFISMHVYFPQSIAEISLTSRIESSPLITCEKAIRKNFFYTVRTCHFRI
jgi:hypothetical protein